MIKKTDLTTPEYDGSELYWIVQRTYAFKEMYNTDTSLIKLKARLETLFKYTDAQWTYLESNFEFDLGERFTNLN